MTQENRQILSHSFNIHSFAVTHQGNVRNLNEDAILNMPDSGIWAVADGMGGHSAGDFASQNIVAELKVLPSQESLPLMVDAVEDALLSVNKKLRTHSRNNLNGVTIGSTVVCLVIKDYVGAVLWVGDSRLYRYRKGVLEQLTRDHSEVQARIDSGMLSAEQAEKSTIKNILSRAVGAFDELAIDVNAFTIEAEDVFLLCSDGLYNELNNNELHKILHKKRLDKMPDDFLQASLNCEAKDNISLIVVKAG